MNLQQAIAGKLKFHADLVSSGVDSTQALNLIAFPMQIENLEQSLKALTTDQLDSLVLLLRSSIHSVEGKKATYYISGIVSSLTGLKIAFTDNVVGVETIEKELELLTDATREEILRAIKWIL